VGVAVLGDTEVTAAVSVTGWPKTAVLAGEAVSTVVVVAAVTVNDAELEVLVKKLVSPRYFALSVCAPTVRPLDEVVATPPDKVAEATTVEPSRN
jgi:hypothetical protein